LIEWWNAERASTSPSTSVTVTQTSTLGERRGAQRLAAEPWRSDLVAVAGCRVGITGRSAVVDEADVADQRLVEDRVERLAVVRPRAVRRRARRES
jgi:hypothetical protein